MHKISYRPDIDGLRGIAIIAVLFFHAFPASLPGGFIGVDVFFVISGFLITSILQNNLETGTFSFLEFYERRIRRIFPALILVLIFCIILGQFLLFADEYKQLTKHVISSALFISNFTLLGESGYFDSAAEAKPLLHLWSLAIEEQFYIVWPLIVFFFRKRLNWVILLLIAISFSWNIFLSHSRPAADFYLPQARAWELLIGCFLASTKFELKKDWASNCGAILILVAVIFVKKKHFPGVWALIPTLGAALIISARNSWLNRKILSHKILVNIGLISYPLYLWHWPLIVFGVTPVLAILLSFILASLTYFLLEKPIQLRKNLKQKVLVLASIMIAVGILGTVPKPITERDEYLAYFNNSLPNLHYITSHNISEQARDDCNFYDLDSYRSGKNTLIPKKEIDKSCYQKNGKKTLFLWGDSHVQHLYPGLKNNLDLDVLIVASSGCSPEIIKEDSKTDYCKRSNWFALKTIREIKPDVVMIAQNTAQEIEGVRKKIQYLKALGVKKIIFIGQAPHWETELPKIIANKLWWNTPDRTFEGINKKVLRDNSDLASQFKESDDVKFIDLIGLLCNDQGCLIRLSEDKKDVVTWDSGHFTLKASDFIAKKLLIKTITN